MVTPGRSDLRTLGAAVADEQKSTEVETLLAYLQSQRRHVLGILEGLDDDALRRSVLPSGWSCIGLVQHLAVDVERFWFRAVLGGEEVELLPGDGGWRVAPDVPTGEVLDLYRREAGLADAIIAAGSPQDMPRWWPEGVFGDMPQQDLRETVLHVTVETACHAGHLDAARELIDGRRWLVLTDE